MAKKLATKKAPPPKAPPKLTTPQAEEEGEEPSQPMTDVVSTMIGAIGWEEGELIVEFLNGETYGYEVPESTFTEMLAAGSKGKYWHEFLSDL